MDRVLITGASGFIGSALVRALMNEGVGVRAAYRSDAPHLIGAESVAVGDLGPGTDWSRALDGVSAVVHLAGPAHAQFEATYLRDTITASAHRLAQQAALAGVRRFVFMSSIKATAAQTTGQLVSEIDTPAPADAYGRAKLAAEQGILASLGDRAIVLRPPLVCAPNAKANFARLLQLADSPFPLPFAHLRNRRSLIGLESLIAAVRAILASPNGRTGVFHVADRPALSTPEIVAALRRGLGRSANQFALPGIGAFLPSPLVESLEVDDTAFRAAYGAGADVSAQHMLTAIAAAWKAAR